MAILAGSDAQAKPVEAGFGVGSHPERVRMDGTGPYLCSDIPADIEILKLGGSNQENLEVKSAWISIEKAHEVISNGGDNMCHMDVASQLAHRKLAITERILFQAPAPSYAADLDELIWIPKTRGARWGWAGICQDGSGLFET